MKGLLIKLTCPVILFFKKKQNKTKQNVSRNKNISCQMSYLLFSIYLIKIVNPKKIKK